MVRGEIRKIIREKMFIVIFAIIMIVDIMTIIYCLGEKDEAYIEYRNDEQSQYIQTYETFIDEMNERGEILISALDDKKSAFYKRNIDKMVSDYQKLSDIVIDDKLNWDMEKYADFTYGIFFCIVFAFVCMEYIYTSERKSGMINILRASKNGRRKMILSKWIAFIILIVIFTLLQEIIVVALDAVMYSMGNMSSSVQSLQIFRDCPYRLSMYETLAFSIVDHIVVAVAVGCVIFFFGITINSRLLEILFPICFLIFEFFNSNDFPINVFYLWDMKKVIGIYGNLNVFGVPLDKNRMAFIVIPVSVCLLIIIGVSIFGIKYVAEIKAYFQKIRQAVRWCLSRLLHLENMYINEWYKLLILQRKWIMILFLCVGIACSYKTFLPDSTYQSAYEAIYHMYLSNIHGKIDDEAENYIEKEKQYIQSVENQIEAAKEASENSVALEVESELENRKKAFERLSLQYDKANAKNGDNYLIDEINLKSIIKKYRSDILIFMGSSIVFVMFISGLYGAKDENRTKLLVQTAKNGGEHLAKVKIRCSIVCGAIIYVISIIPSIYGYSHILKIDELKLKLNGLYDPQIEWGITLFTFLALVYIIRGIIYLLLGGLTTIMARKSKNEFVVSIFVSMIILIISMIFYFSKSNIAMILINIANRGN